MAITRISFGDELHCRNISAGALGAFLESRDSATPYTSIVANFLCHSIPTQVFNYKYFFFLCLLLPVVVRPHTITKTETKDWRYLFHWKDISELLNDVPGPIKLVLERLTERPLLKGVSNGANFVLLSGDVIELPRRLRISLCGRWARGRGGQERGSPRKTSRESRGKGQDGCKEETRKTRNIEPPTNDTTTR